MSSCAKLKDFKGVVCKIGERETNDSPHVFVFANQIAMVTPSKPYGVALPSTEYEVRPVNGEGLNTVEVVLWDPDQVDRVDVFG